MILTITGLLLVGYVPGALLFRLPVSARERRARLSADERAFWAVIFSLALSLVVTLALALVGQYRFERLLTINAGVSILIALAGRSHLSFRGGAARPTCAALVPLAFVVFGWLWYLPPAEYVLGGKDPGAYVNAGIQIAQRGAIVVEDPVVASVPPATRDLFFPPHGQSTYYSLRFMGFFVLDPQAGTVISQFPHLYPASIAIGYGLNGLSGARQASAAWAVLGLLAVYFLTARLAGRTVAAGAVALLAVNVIEIWYARYPNAEVVMQTLLFAAMLAGSRALVDGDRFFGPVSGLLLGLLLFLRIDAVVAIAAVVAAVVLAWITRRRIGPGFVMALALTCGLAFWYLFDLMAPYTALPLVFARNLGPMTLAAVAGLVVTTLLVVTLRSRVSEGVQTWAPRAFAIVLAALAVYAWFFRSPVGKLAWHDAMGLRTFAWYVAPWGLVAAVAGLGALAWRRFWRDPLFFTTAGVFAAFFFYKIRIVPEHFWMTRRFLPVILPAAMIGMAALAAWVCSPEGPLRWGRGKHAQGDRAQPAWARVTATVLTLALLAVPGVAYWRASRLVARHVEYAGLIPHLEQLAARLGERDLLIVESRNASDLHVFALPVAYIYARPALVLASPRPDRQAFEAFLDWARTRYREIYFLGGGGTDLLSARVAVAPVASERFQVPEYDSPVNAYPAGVRQKEFDFGLYRFVRADAAPTGQVTLTIGALDDLNVVRFHAKEREAQSGQVFRWTRDVSYVTLVGLTAASASMTVWMSNGQRPASAGPADVEVFLDERPLGRVTVGPDLAPYAFDIAPELARAVAARDDPPRVKIVSSTWNPQKALGVADPRDLGVRVMKIEVR